MRLQGRHCASLVALHPFVAVVLRSRYGRLFLLHVGAAGTYRRLLEYEHQRGSLSIRAQPTGHGRFRCVLLHCGARRTCVDERSDRLVHRLVVQLDWRDDRIEIRAFSTGARLCDAELCPHRVQVDRVHLGNQRLRRLADGEETDVGKVRRARDELKPRNVWE